MKIVYEDRQIMVVYKEPGLAVQTASLRSVDLDSLLRRHLAQKGEGSYLGIVHRLDQPVGGLLVFAKTPKAAAALSEQVQDGRMEKIYLARTAKKDPERTGTTGTMTDLLLKDARSNLSKVVKPGTKGAKKAVLEYRFLTEDTVLIHLGTGRHHQIRVQFASRGWGLEGDRKYAGAEGGFPALVSCRLTFIHPVSGKVMTFTAEDTVLQELGYHVTLDENMFKL